MKRILIILSLLSAMTFPASALASSLTLHQLHEAATRAGRLNWGFGPYQGIHSINCHQSTCYDVGYWSGGIAYLDPVYVVKLNDTQAQVFIEDPMLNEPSYVVSIPSA